MPRNARHTASGDTQFMGMAPRLDPVSLPEGMAHEARNCRFRHGVAETRKGLYKCPWVNNITPELDSKVRPFGEIHGVGVFRNPNNLEFVLIAADNNVYYTRQNNNPIKLALPSPIKITGRVTFIQAFNKMVMYRGKDFAPLVMTSEDTGFADMIQQWDSTASYAENDEVAFGPLLSVSHSASTLLNADINDTATTITLKSTAAFPASGTFTIDSETCLYTGVSGDTLTGLTRGHSGTTAASHTAGATVNITGDGITYAGGVATVTTSSSHGYETGADVTIAGATEAEFNGRHYITKVNTTQFTFETTSTNTAATGTITVTNNEDYYRVSDSGGTSAGESPSTTSSKWAKLSTIMPTATHGVFIANRIVAPTTFDSDGGTYGSKRDFVAVSDALSVSKTFFDQVFRVNYGSDDEILDAVAYDENRLLVMKEKSVHMITGFIVTDTSATLGNSVSIQPIIHNYGVSGRDATVVVGGDVYFYASRRGVVSLAQTEEAKVRGVDIPLSEPIQPLIDRIDVRYESNVRLAYWDSKLWVACPIDDGSSGNNAILVYDFLNKAWASHDSGDAVKPKEFFTATYNNAQRLFIVGEDGYISLLEENWAGDDVQDLTEGDGLKQQDIEFYLLTRGYHETDIDHRDFKQASVSLATWNPKYTIKALTDGVGESQTLTADREKDRTKYYRPFDAEPWSRNNSSDDFNTPYREDYSVPLDLDRGVLTLENGDMLAMESGNGILSEDGVGGFNLGTAGVVFSRMQETLEAFSLAPRKGRYSQIEITNTQGNMHVSQAVITNQQGDRTINVKS